MKTLNNNLTNNAKGKRSLRMATGLASAAVILSLTACVGDTLDDLQADLANGEDITLNVSTNDDGNLVIGLADDGIVSDDDDGGDADGDADSDGDDGAAATSSITVTLTNTSEHQPMTPPVVLLHNAPDADNGMRLFELGQPAIDPIIAIAENGNNGPMVDLLGYLTDQGRVSASAVAFADPENPGPLLPGMSATIDLDLVSEDQRLSIVSMVVCTNDGFSAANAHTLSADASETFVAPIYDAGSETNVLTLNYWVPPCSPDGSENLTDNENGSITLHPGQDGSENTDFDFEPGTRWLEVTVDRN